MRLVWRWQVVYLTVLVASTTLVYAFGLSLNELLVGVAAAQWAGYGLAVITFVRRNALDSGLVATSHIVHGLTAIVVFASSAWCAYVVRDADVGVQVSAELAVTVGCALTLFLARRWFPASRVLERRMAQAMPGRRVPRLTCR